MTYSPGFNKMEWRPRAINMPANSGIAHAAGVSICSDLTHSEERVPTVFMLASNTALYKYSIKYDGWGLVGSPGLAGTFGAGAGCLFFPGLGPTGTIGTGNSTTMINTTTTMTSVAVNQLGDRGTDSKGFRIRIIGKTSGKTEEVEIDSNTSGTTPTIYLKTPLTFTPSSGDVYEILSGRVFMLGAGTTAAGSWKYYDLATNAFSGNLGTTNLPATIGTEFSAIALAERYVPKTKQLSEGFFGVLTATAANSTTLTGQAASGDAVVQANEYRNFQIRIVEDTVNPTAVGQREIIASHTAGASPVYTMGTSWDVTPSANAKYVIENPNLIMLFSSGSASTFIYNPMAYAINNGTNSIAANAWSVTYFGNRTAPGAGNTTFPSFGTPYDPYHLARHSYIWSFRGGNSTALDMLDIAGSATGTWTNGIAYGGAGPSFTTGTCGKVCPAVGEGSYGYIAFNNTNNFFRFDVADRRLQPYTQIRYPQSGTAAVGDRLCSTVVFKDDVAYGMLLFLGHLSANFFDLVIVDNN